MADDGRPMGERPEDGPKDAAPGPSPPHAEPYGRPIETALAEAPDGIVVVDGEGTIRLCNPAAAVLFGRPAEELLGLPFGFPVTARGATEIDLVLPSASGRVVEMRVTATRASGERLHIATLRDVTERRRTQRALEEALEQQGIVIAVTAHELRNPLATINVLAHTLRDASARLTDEQRTDLADRIVERTSRLQTLVRRHLTAARIDAHAMHPVPQPVPVLEFILEQIAARDEGGPRIDVVCEPGVTVYVDRGDFWEMLVNYLENASAHGSPPISVHVTESPDHVDISVRDNGPGVPPDVVPHLFERFTPASRIHGRDHQKPSTGLGLWIARNLARSSGGDAWYEPGPGETPTFSLRLPRA
ncbi:PAS domain-containing sensor histidine kinase [Streptomyces sp. NPDC046853]|uniref:PAS domain-containing sensor histidine kinase n=1 Tax=unclassified Streptomyces TaxID=2593676 RepID=UPI0033F7F402